ncbi:DUF2937 family protein [Thalassotalea euphylliae]|uniref:DUF2937 family protein n=1 Tax=Thalassotalea euphylliae TaxID=1655234 RepID=A0A3E0TS97_9GAMM|nr:DUF2937 family protein [Thalassotalea euphylliae]REL26795.1 DUF2937 family protein [Thalassotalea euphylliae]
MITTAIKSTLDYCLFTLGFILAVQLPEFIQQYKQYLAGKLSETQWHLNGYQQIADQNYQGSLPDLIQDYLASGKQAIEQTGQLVNEMLARKQSLADTIASLESSSYIEQVFSLLTKVNVEDAETVLSYYQLAIPLTVEALASGVVLAFTFIWLRMLFTGLFGRMLPQGA